MPEMNMAVALLTVRIFAGTLFVFQGYDKIFRLGMGQLKATMIASLGERALPSALIGFVAATTSWIEFLGGLFLIGGLLMPWVIYLLCLDLIVISVGFSLAKPMWDTGHVFTRLILLLILLVAPPASYAFSLDALLGI